MRKPSTAELANLVMMNLHTYELLYYHGTAVLLS